MAIGNHNDLTHIVRTSDQWKNTYDKYELIPVGVLCVELVSSDVTKIKIGDGHNIFSKLPYIGDLDLSKYYTKLETDTRIKEILTQEKVVRIKGIIGSKSDLPADARCGDIYFVRQLSSSDNKYIEYIYSPDNTWEPLGGIPVDIDLSEYAKTAYVDDKIEQVNERIDDIEQHGTHTHSNKEILDQITEPYTTADKETLASLHNYDDTEIREMISQSSHTHDNKDILDATSAAFTREDKSKLDQLNPYDDSTIKERITELERVAHEHSNKRILDRTTASFTTEYERKMRWIRLYTGCTGMEEGIAGLVPAAQAGEEDYVLSGSGEWVPQTGGGGTYELPIATTSTLGGIKVGDGLEIDANGKLSVVGGGGGGDSIAEGDGIIITTDPQTGVKTISVNTGDHLEVDENTGELNVTGVDYEAGQGIHIGSQYNFLEFIKNSGNYDQVIVTDIIPSFSTKIKMDIKFGAAIARNWRPFVGCGYTGTDHNKFQYIVSLDNASPSTCNIAFYNKFNWTEYNTGSNFIENPYGIDYYGTNPVRQILTMCGSNGSWGNTTRNFSNEIMNDFVEPYIPMAIFGTNRITTPTAFIDNELWVYSVKIYDDNAETTLLYDLRPAERVSDGEAGLYDVINHKFYGNAGGGSFVKGTVIPSDDRIINAKIGNGLQFDSNNAIEVNTGDGLSINQDNELEVNVGNGLQINQDDELEIDPSIIPEVTEYEAGEAIEITEVTHGDEFRVQNQEYFFDTRGLTCGLNARVWTTVNDGDILAAMCIHNNGGNQVPLFVGLTEDSVKVSQNYNSTILGPNGSFDYRGKTWYFTADYALSGTDGQDTQGHIQTLPTTYSFNSTPSNFVPAAKDLIDLAVLLSDLEYPVISVKYNKGLTVNQDNELEVNIGSGLSFNQDGEIEADQYTLPTASANTLGGVKVGTGLSIESDGTLSVVGGSGGGNYSDGDAIEIDTSSFNVDAIRWDISDIKDPIQTSSANGPWVQARYIQFRDNSNNVILIDSGSGVWSDDTAVSYYQDLTLANMIANTRKMCASWRSPDLTMKLTFLLDSPVNVSSVAKFRILLGDDEPRRDPKTWSIYVRNATTQEWHLVHSTADAQLSDTRNVWTDDFLLENPNRSTINVKYGDGLTLNQNNELEVSPATQNSIGGIKIGDGLSIDENGVVSSKLYEAGQGITFDEATPEGQFKVRNLEYYFDNQVSCQIDGTYGPRTFTRVSQYEQCLAVIWPRTISGQGWTNPLFVGLTENSVKLTSSADSNILGPSGSFEYRGYTWYYTCTYGLMNSSGVDLLGNLQTMNYTDSTDEVDGSKHLIDLAGLVLYEESIDVWNSGTGWLNGAYNDGQSDQFWTNWYYTYHSKQNEYLEVPAGAIKMRQIGISNENDSRLQGGGVDCFNSSHHHFTTIGCITDEWADIPEGTVYLQFGVKWNELNNRTISSSDIKSVTIEFYYDTPRNDVINAKLGNGLEFDSNDAIQAKLGSGLGFDSNGAIEVTGGGGDNYSAGEAITIRDVSSTLPAGYVEVDYIEGVGNYTVINYIPNRKTKIIGTASQTQTSDDPVLFGNRTGSNGQQFVFWFNRYDSTRAKVGFVYGTNTWSTSSDCDAGKLIPYTLEDQFTFLISLDDEFNINDSFVHNITENGAPASNLKLGIFALVSNSSDEIESSDQIFRGRMYEFKIYEDDELVVNLIPAISTSTNQGGFYDVINDIFYTSKTATPFGYDPSTIHSTGKVIDVNYGNGLTVNQNNELEINTGDGLSVNADNEVEISKATSNTLGGIKVGSGFVYTSDGLLNATPAAPPFDAGDGLELIYDDIDALPNGYGHVDYVCSNPENNLINANGRARTLIDYISTNTTKLAIKMQRDSERSDLCFIGSRIASRNHEFCFWNEYDSTTELAFSYGGTNYSDASATYSSYITGQIIEVECVVGDTSNTLSVNGTVIKTYTKSGDASPYKLGIFQLYLNESWAYQPANGKIYYIKLYEGDTLAVNLIPAVRLVDEAVGFYDNVNDKFYTSNTEYPFTTDMATLVIDGGNRTLNVIPATANTIGGIKVGDGLSIESDGTLSVVGGSGGGNYSAGDAIEFETATDTHDIVWNMLQMSHSWVNKAYTAHVGGSFENDSLCVHSDITPISNLFSIPQNGTIYTIEARDQNDNLLHCIVDYHDGAGNHLNWNGEFISDPTKQYTSLSSAIYISVGVVNTDHSTPLAISDVKSVTLTWKNVTETSTEISVKYGTGLSVDPITNELFVDGQLPEGTIIKKLTYVGDGSTTNSNIHFSKKPLSILSLNGLVGQNYGSVISTPIDAPYLHGVWGGSTGSGTSFRSPMSYDDTTNTLSIQNTSDVGLAFNISGVTYTMFYLTKGHTGSGNSVNNEVSVVKTFSYVGTGTSTNDIQFPETPDMILKISGPLATGDITTAPIEINHPTSNADYMTIYTQHNGGSNTTSVGYGVFSFNDSTNVLTLTGGDYGDALNYSGGTYYVQYIVNEVIASTMPYDAGEAISIETIGGLQLTDFSNADFIASITRVNGGDCVKAADNSTIALSSWASDCYTVGIGGDNSASGSYAYNVKANTQYRLEWDSSDPTIQGRIMVFENAGYDNVYVGEQSQTSFIEFTTTSNCTFITTRLGITNAYESVTYSNVRLYEYITDGNQYNEISVKHGNGLSVNQNNELEVNIGTGLAFDPQTGAINVTGGGGGSGDTVAQGAGIEITTDQQTGNKVIAVNAGTGLQVDQTTNELEIDDSVVTEDDELSLVFVPDDYQPS